MAEGHKCHGEKYSQTARGVPRVALLLCPLKWARQAGFSQKVTVDSAPREAWVGTGEDAGNQGKGCLRLRELQVKDFQTRAWQRRWMCGGGRGDRHWR